MKVTDTSACRNGCCLSACRSCSSKPDVVSFTTVIGGLSCTGDWRQALEVLNSMSPMDIKPNVQTYGAAILACARVRDTLCAMFLAMNSVAL